MALTINTLGCQNRPSEYKGLPRIPAQWTYSTTDDLDTLKSVGYFNGAYIAGLRHGDRVAIGYKDGITGEDKNILGVISESDGHFTMNPITIVVDLDVLASDIPFTVGVETDTGILLGNYAYPDRGDLSFRFVKDGVEYAMIFKTDFVNLVPNVRIVRSITVGNSSQNVEVWLDDVDNSINFLFTSSGGTITATTYSMTVVDFQ